MTETHDAGLSPHALRRRALPVVIGLTVLVLIALLAPGLDEVRDRLGGAAPGWLVVAVALEAASCVSYVLLFKPIFRARSGWRPAFQLGLSEVAVGSLLPASGGGGLALGAVVLRREGKDPETIAKQSVAFFIVKGSVNFVAVAILGLLMFAGLGGADLSPGLTLVPALMSIATIAAIVLAPRIGPGREPGSRAGRLGRGVHQVRQAAIQGAAAAVEVVRSRDVLVIAGAIGYWAFDNAVLWATFHAVGEAPAITVILLGYLIGQLGGLLPIPGGVGGIDGGLIGTLIVYGTPAAATVGAVLAYRMILFWVPLVVGVLPFVSQWRELDRAEAEAEAIAAASG